MADNKVEIVLSARDDTRAGVASAQAGLKGMETSAAQTAAALRSVPAQMTDIVVSLASGQQPLTVLLQQGGQLKDMFGGVGNAAKAISGYVLSLLTPINVVAAAAAGLGVAFYSGATEADEFRKNLILTGNASGMTVDKFNQMTAAIAGLSGVTRGAAAEALTAMAASGNVGAESLQRFTAAALQLKSAGGTAVADTVKQFEDLGKEPVSASIKLNEQTHYLTLAVYEQIKALEDQGKTSEAGALAQQAWADAIEQRTPQMLENLGYLQRAWRGIKEGVAEAVDAAKEWGRAETKVEQAIRLQTRIGNIDDSLKDPTRAYEWNRLRQIRQQLKTELDGINADINKAQSAAATAAATAARDQAQLAANVAADKLIEGQRSKREKHARELKLLDEQRAKELLSEEKYQQAKAALAKKYEEKPKAAKADKVENAYNTLLDSLNKQLGAAEKLNAVEKLNIELQEKKYAKLNPAQKESLKLIAEQIDAQKRAEAEGKATLTWIADGAEAQKKALKSLSDELEKVTREVATYGKSRSEVAAYELGLIDEQIAAEKALNEEIGVGSSELLRNLEKQRDKRQELLEQASKLDQLDAGKKAAEEAAKAAQKVAAEWEKAIDRIDQAFHDAFVKGIEAASGSLDAFTDSLRTSLKAAVADGLYQLTFKPLVVGFMGALSGAASANPATQGGAGAAQSGLGIMSGLQAAWSGVTGGVANAANSFALSGMGQAVGLSTAGSVATTETAIGTLQVETAGGLTAAGTTFAAAAAPVLGALTAAYAIAEMQKSGWGIDNDKKSGALAAVSVGTLGANVILDRLFGHNRNVSNDAQGITGTFDLSGFEGQSYQERSQKGGAFRSDRRWTDYSAIGSDMDKALDSMLKQAVSGVQTIGKALNVETENALQGFSHTFALQLSENGDMSKAGEKIAAELKKVQDELATRLVPNISDFARYGESASDTFSRLNQEVAATDAILLAMGKNASESFGAVGLASVKAREDLIDLAGGIDKLASKTQSFYANFYSSDEQMKLAATQAQKVLDKGFTDLGLTLPTDRKGFRSLVESYGNDLSTEGNRKLFNALLDLQDEFDAVADAAESSAEKIKSASDKLTSATDAAKQGQGSLFDTFASDAQKLDAAKKLVSDTFASIGKDVPASAAAFLQLSQSIDPATEAGQSLITALSKVSNVFAYVEKSAADSSAALVASAQAIAQASQSRRSVQDQFDPAGSAARAQADINAAFAKYGATNLIPTTREGVAQLAGTIDVNSSLGQEQMAALQSLSGAFDAVFGAQERAAQEAAAAAQSSINAAKTAADEQMRLANQVHDSISGALKSLLGQSEEFESQTRQMAQATLQSALVIAKAGGSLSNFQGLDAALASVTKLDKATFATATGYAVEFGRTANLLTQLEQYTRINGSHENGLDYVPFDGYVAQLHRGERVQTAASAAAADATVEEVKALRQDLNAIGAALATYTQKTAKLMAKFDVEGIYTRA